MRVERCESGPAVLVIRGIKGDGETNTVMGLVVEEDGDVTLELIDQQTWRKLEIQFCTAQGGTHNPGLAKCLSGVAEHLYNISNQKAERLTFNVGSKFILYGIQGDMGEDTTLNLLSEDNGDIVIELFDPIKSRTLSLKFNALESETNYPSLAIKFREVAEHLYNLKRSK